MPEVAISISHPAPHNPDPLALALLVQQLDECAFVAVFKFARLIACNGREARSKPKFSVAVSTLKLTPNDAHAYGLRALVWAKKGDRSRALADFDEANRLAPKTQNCTAPIEIALLPSPRAPIEGGDFSILKNPFVLLGLPPTAAPAMVKEAYEDAVEDEVDDVDVLM